MQSATQPVRLRNMRDFKGEGSDETIKQHNIDIRTDRPVEHANTDHQGSPHRFACTRQRRGTTVRQRALSDSGQQTQLVRRDKFLILSLFFRYF